jgi:peptide/nickel transport system ATP-binding protein
MSPLGGNLPETSLLEARDLTVTATLGGKPVEAIRQLSFTLPPGRILGLVGESGAGKSMIGRAIAQALPRGFAITGGSLRLSGEDLLGVTPVRRRSLLGKDIAFIPQEPMTALNPVMTIGAQFFEHLKRLGISDAAERRARALAAFASVHLPDGAELLGRYPHQLSGGMCQRVLIAMAFASRPRLVIADEPTTALDVTIQARIVQLIAEMQRRDGTGVVFITHDLRLAARICDEIIVLYAGRAVERGPATALLSAPAHPYTRCLQLAAPAMARERRALYVLPEQMPGLAALASMQGCRFFSRCPVAGPECREVDPAAVMLAPLREAACLHLDRIAGIQPLPEPPFSVSAAQESAPVLGIEAVAKSFAGGSFWRRRVVQAVRPASFSVASGEFVGLVGESGSGKSTLARLVMGLEAASAGRILLGGEDVTAPGSAARRQRLALAQMVFQDPQSALNPRRRVADIITQPLQAPFRLTSPAERAARAASLLQEVGLAPEMAARFPAQLSGGQRQRVNIARALCAVPSLLVADEIVSGLDVSVQAQLLELLLRLRAERGIAMLFISHDLSVVRHLCDRVLVMYRGEIVEQGQTEQVFDAPLHPYTRRLLAAVPPDDLFRPWRPFPEEAERDAAPTPVEAMETVPASR